MAGVSFVPVVPFRTVSPSVRLVSRFSKCIRTPCRRRLPPRMSTSPSTSPAQPESTPSESLSGLSSPTSHFYITRLFIFFQISTIYSLYVTLRSTFTYAAPLLSLPLSTIGTITSIFPLTYASSRLLTGYLIDRTKPHYALCLGLLLAGLTNVFMSFFTTPKLLALCWGLNGLVQGVGAGASAKMLTAWFNRKERGLFWALWSAGANVGAFVAPIAVAWLGTWGGFSGGVMVPGLVAMGIAMLCVGLLRSSPRDAGMRVEWDEEKKVEQGKVSFREAFVQGVVRNKVMWGLMLSYVCVYFIRTGLKSWLPFFLIETRAINAAEAAIRVSGMEVGGVVGTFSAGVVSDWADGRRVLVCMVYLALLAVAMGGMWKMGGGRLADWVGGAVLGLLINGPQMAIGLVGAEVCDRRVVATATGMLGLVSYMGAAAAGLPLSLVVRKVGWSGAVAVLTGCAVLSVVFLMPFWNVRGGERASA